MWLRGTDHPAYTPDLSPVEYLLFIIIIIIIENRRRSAIADFATLKIIL
jgi:hypothetical protein